MTIITVEVPEEVASKFANKSIVQYEDILEYEEELKYNFSDEKVSLNELSDFIEEMEDHKFGKIIKENDNKSYDISILEKKYLG